jgi:hypothetical protein
MIFVDLFLQFVAKPQLAAYVWRALINNRRQPAPKLAGADIASRQDFVADEVAQNLRNPDFSISRKPSCSSRLAQGLVGIDPSCLPPRSPASSCRENTVPASMHRLDKFQDF